MKQPYLIFDAGGVLVFPDFHYLSLVAAEAGIQITVEQLFLAHCMLILDLDHRTKNLGYLADPFPNGYIKTLLKGLQLDPQILDRLAQTIEERNQDKSLWESTYPWVADTLKTLRSAGYGLSVISNADGRVELILESLGLRAHFDQVFDSHHLKVSKPDRRIFDIALDKLQLQPQNALYIGDVFYIDVWGANQAGIGCIHLDPKDLYQDWPGVHLPTIAQLPDWLTEYHQKPKRFDLYPGKNLSISY